MVNIGLRLLADAGSPHSGTAKSHGKSGLFTVNESFSKHFEFSENSRRILFECRQKPEQPLQPCLLACHAASSQSRPTAPNTALEGTEQGYGTMFFLLRLAFWLTLVLALLPSGSGAQSGAQAKVAASDAMVAAGAVISDMSNFCERQPDACVAGANAAIAIGQRAQAGARMVYDFVGEHATRGDADRSDKTGSVSVRKLVALGAVPTSQNTLKPSDLEPAWQGPPAKTQGGVPLPRKNPFRNV